MNRIFGYARISRKTQNIERQIRNIRESFPDVYRIYQEAYTGRKVEGRKEFYKLLKAVKSGDVIVFDSVSRMSRNAEEGINLYFELYNKGVNLVFLKERHIDTDAYKKALESTGIKFDNTDDTAEGTLVSEILEAINKFMKAKASDDITKAFEQSQKEVDDLRNRTIEGIETARRNGKQIGQKKGTKLVTSKSIEKKSVIRKLAKDFGGDLSDVEVMSLTGLARNTYYRYKKQLFEELAQPEQMDV